MARNIKKIAHDLLPLSDAVTELSAIICIRSLLVGFAKYMNQLEFS